MALDDIPELMDPDRASDPLRAEHWVRTVFFDHPNDPPTSLRIVGWLYHLDPNASRLSFKGVDLSDQADLPEADADGC